MCAQRTAGRQRLPVGGGVRTPGRSRRWRDEGRGLAGLGCQLACLHPQDLLVLGSRRLCAGATGRIRGDTDENTVLGEVSPLPLFSWLDHSTCA